MGTKSLLKIKLASLILFFGLTTIAQAASLSLSTNNVSLETGEVITINLMVNTAGQSINNASGKINFPTDLLEAVSVSKTGSVFSLWVEEPSISNSQGVINFEGGVPNPGFNGPAGKILSVVFRAKAKGIAPISISNASVRANDGLGTEVLNNTVGRTLDISEPPPVSPKPEASISIDKPSATTSLATSSDEAVLEILPTIPVASSAPLIIVEGKSYGEILSKVLGYYLTQTKVLTSIIIFLLIVTLFLALLLSHEIKSRRRLEDELAGIYHAIEEEKNRRSRAKK